MPAFVDRVVIAVRARPRSQKLGALAAAGVLATAPFGGLTATDPPQPDELRPELTVQAGPFDTTVHRLVGADSLGESISPRDGERLLALALTVTNDTDSPAHAHLLGQALTLTGVELATPDGMQAQPRIVSIADSTEVRVINPGLTMELALVWEHSQPAGSVEQVDVELERLTFAQETELTLFGDYWLRTGVIEARGTFDVEKLS